jgi:hypothetical protein
MVIHSNTWPEFGASPGFRKFGFATHPKEYQVENTDSELLC